jgi:SPX domain protein involved in polyphosphate accumulation
MSEPASQQIANSESRIVDHASHITHHLVTTTPPRYEVKIPLPAHWLADVETWVRLHPAQWRVTYPPRQVNNVYFDTAHYDGLNANLSSADDRDKLRLRWYGTDLTHIVGANLERKHKQGMVGWKVICPVEGTFGLAETTWRALSHTLQATVIPEVRQWLDVFAIPMLINHYWRVYYATPDDAVRLTLDTALRAYDQRAAACPNLTLQTHADASIVVELKASTDDASFQQLSEALAHFPAPVDRFSKYVQGVMA